MWKIDEERAFRDDLIQSVIDYANEGDGTLSRNELGEFSYKDQIIRLIDLQRGIWNPGRTWTITDPLNATLSINTTNSGIYEDSVVSNELWRYDYQAGNAEGANTRLRAAKDLELPLLWFVQQENRKYIPFKVYIIEDFPHDKYCLIAPDLFLAKSVSSTSEVERRYAKAEVKRRLHQPIFRSRVLHAYKTRCAVCALNHGSLLDAAHITPDSEEHSSTSVTNGLSLCKIHHAAFDKFYLGIDSNLKIHIKNELLKQKDGPMLQHGLKDMHKSEISVPAQLTSQPDRDRLAEKFQNFRQRNN